MNRRGFLLGTAAAGAALAATELWIPKRTWFLPTWKPRSRNQFAGFNPYTYNWSWESGGSGLTIVTPKERGTTFIPSRPNASGVARLTITDSAGKEQRIFTRIAVTQTGTV